MVSGEIWTVHAGLSIATTAIHQIAQRVSSGNAARFLLIFQLILASLTATADELPVADHSLIWQPATSLAHTAVSQETIQQTDGEVQRFRIVNRAIPETLEVHAATPPSMLHNDFEASLRVHSNVRGLRLGLRLVLPHQQDPRTRAPFETVLPGEIIQHAEEWQTVRVKATQKAVEAQMRRVRAGINQPDIRTHQPLVTGLVLIIEATPGETFFELGPATFGPVIAPPKPLMQIVSSTTDLSPATSASEPSFIPIDVELGGLMLDHKPVILRMAPDHFEHVETLHQMGLNAVWVSDYRETTRAKELFEARVAVLATPPHPQFEPGDYTRIIQALPPLDQQCPNVSAWYQGTRVTPEEYPYLLALSREVRSADRAFQRLQIADVTAAEGAVAREIDLVGIGKHIVGRDETFGSLRNLLVRRQQTAGQLTFPWTWIQTEPSSAQQLWRSRLGYRQPYVEPEQIQQGVYAALSAGFKGLGFWKTHALQIDNPADLETSIAIELACLEIELLEPFLARGRTEGHLALETSSGAGSTKKNTKRSSLNAALAGRLMGVSVDGTDGPSAPDAAVISSNGNTLILATAWDNVSQFVPGPMYDAEVSLIVAASETASACQISTTGYTALPREVTAGGLSLKIKNFNQNAALVVFSNPAALIPGLKQRIHAMAPRAAAKQVELAALKHVRVLETIELLRDAHTVPANVDHLMTQARQMLDRAELELSNKDYHDAAQRAKDAMFYTRRAQHACWKDATDRLTSATASPHTISFSTLPDHWRLMHYIDQQGFRLSENLLPGGDFETLSSVEREGWTLSIPEKSAYSATADILQDNRTGKILRMIAWKPEDSASRSLRDDQSPLIVTTPAIEATTGDVMVVTGRVRKGRSTSTENRKPLVIFDSELGPVSGLRIPLYSDWESFELIRPVGINSSFTISFALAGQGEIEEVHLDDLSIRRLPSMSDGNPVRLTGDLKYIEPETDTDTQNP